MLATLPILLMPNIPAVMMADAPSTSLRPAPAGHKADGQRRAGTLKYIALPQRPCTCVPCLAEHVAAAVCCQLLHTCRQGEDGGCHTGTQLQESKHKKASHKQTPKGVMNPKGFPRDDVAL
jgi:hypothetical protein